MATTTSSRKALRKNELQQAVGHCWSVLGTVGVFSAIINVLMLTQPIYMLQVYDRVLTTGHRETLAALTVITALGLALLCALDGLRSAVTIRMGSWLNDKLGPVYLAAGVRAQLTGNSAAGAQPLRDLAQIQNFVSTQGLTVFFDFPWVPFFIALIWLLHPVLGMAALIATVVLLVLGLLNELATRAATTASSQSQIEAMHYADATIRNAEVVSAMGMLPAMIERWRLIHREGLSGSKRAAEIGAVLLSFTKFTRFFVQVAILGLGALLVLDGSLTAGSMIAASLLLGRALAPVEVAIGAWRNFSSARLAYGRLKGQIEAFPTPALRTRLPVPLGRIAIEKLTYMVPDTQAVILRQVSFAVEPGEIVAVIGPSGAGKSSLCRVITGLIKPTAGKVRVDGSEVGHWNPLQLGRYVGYLPQDVELFAGTVRENVARMTNGPDEEVVEAARLAHAHDIIQRMPKGYDTEIGDRGGRLSGGQRQRIGLARAVYGDPKIMILDEPNANLDQAGEAALAAALGELKARGAAILVVGHRPSTLAQADKVLLMKDGQVEKFGPRDEVLQKLRRAAATSADKANAAGVTGRQGEGGIADERGSSASGEDAPRTERSVEG